MLRVEMHDALDALIMRIDGRFTEKCANQLHALVTRCKTSMRLVVDLSEVTFVDSIGEAALLWLKRVGAEFVAKNWYALDLCERLHLPLFGKRARFVRGPVPRPSQA